MHTSSKVYVAGHNGMVGSAIVRRLKSEGFDNLVLRNRQELDLTEQDAVEHFFSSERPDYVLLAAAKVGGIHANSTLPAEFIHQNLSIQTNVIHAAWRNKCLRLLFLGSSCIYPRDSPQPISEKHLLAGPLEQTNEPYAIAKIAGLKMCQAYTAQYGFSTISAMPTNLYGPGDNFHPQNSHVIAGLIHRIYEAKISGAREVIIWGTGKPLREFLHVDDLADACIHLMQLETPPGIANIGSGTEISISSLASLIAELLEFDGQLEYDVSRPDGTPRKRLDTSLMDSIGWRASISLRTGLKDAISAYITQRKVHAKD